MQAKEFMLEVEKAEKELKLIEAKKRHFRELATSMGGTGGSIPKNPTGESRVEKAAVAIADLITHEDVIAKGYVELVKKAEALIDKLPQFKFRQVLTLRYLAGLSFRSVSDEMGYKSEKSVYLTHGYALTELQKLL